MGYQDLPVQYTLTITATRPGAGGFGRIEPPALTVINVTGDYPTVRETLRDHTPDGSALNQLDRFDAALTIDPDARVSVVE